MKVIEEDITRQCSRKDLTEY